VLGGSPNPPLLLQVQDVVSGAIPESELACALILKELLTRATTHTPAQVNLWPQFQITRQGFSESLQQLVRADGQLFYLVENGESLDNVDFDFAAPLVFVLGDHQGVPSDHEEVLTQQHAQKISIGERSLLGSQIITLLLLELARRLGIERSTSEETPLGE
jgi:tRNA pseudouridine-54 N-methylase